ncbi:MAG: type II toxin-antitoxin system RelE/ParE family toxin [Flavobacteriales bacterium]
MEIIISSVAENEIEEIRNSLGSDGFELSDRFHLDVLQTLRYIAQFPGGVQIRSKMYRYAPLQAFRYHLIYSIEGEVAVVHRIRHMHQRPLRRYFGRQG